MIENIKAKSGEDFSISIIKDVDPDNTKDDLDYHYSPFEVDGKIFFTETHMEAFSVDDFEVILAHEIAHKKYNEEPRYFMQNFNDKTNKVLPFLIGGNFSTLPIAMATDIISNNPDFFCTKIAFKANLLSATAISTVALGVKLAMEEVINFSENRADKYSFNLTKRTIGDALDKFDSNPVLLKIGEILEKNKSFLERMDGKYFSGYDSFKVRTERQFENKDLKPSPLVKVVDCISAKFQELLTS